MGVLAALVALVTSVGFGYWPASGARDPLQELRRRCEIGALTGREFELLELWRRYEIGDLTGLELERVRSHTRR